MKREERLDRLTVPQLVKLYASSPGAEDAVGPEFKRRGAPARDELIRMLDAVPSADLRSDAVGTIVEILEYKFPSQATYDAVERLQSRCDCPPGRGFENTLALLRAKMSGRFEAWLKAPRPKSAEEQDLQYSEFLLANCRPADRVHFLASAAWSGLNALENARKVKDEKLQRTDKAKATAFAREILATPDVATKSGEGVYCANHLLGMVAFYQGNLTEAKNYLVESGKAFGSSSFPLPDFSLVSSLLERGERDAVCEYLDNLKVSAKRDALIERWRGSIRSGGVPDFFEEWVKTKPR